jgi:hypothetical protein
MERRREKGLKKKKTAVGGVHDLIVGILSVFYIQQIINFQILELTFLC